MDRGKISNGWYEQKKRNYEKEDYGNCSRAFHFNLGGANAETDCSASPMFLVLLSFYQSSTLLGEAEAEFKPTTADSVLIGL